MTDDWPHPSAMCRCGNRFDKHAYDTFGKELICTAVTYVYEIVNKKTQTTTMPCRCQGFRPKEATNE